MPVPQRTRHPSSILEKLGLTCDVTMSGRTTLRNSRAGADPLEQGRDAFRQRAWSEAFLHFAAADRESPLAPGDLNLFAQVALLTGREVEGADLLYRAHQAFLSAGEN